MEDDPFVFTPFVFAAIRAGKGPAEAQYLFEEVCAKSLYNLTATKTPFDPDSPYWIIPNALHAAELLKIELSRVLEIAMGRGERPTP